MAAAKIALFLFYFVVFEFVYEVYYSEVDSSINSFYASTGLELVIAVTVCSTAGHSPNRQHIPGTTLADDVRTI